MMKKIGIWVLLVALSVGQNLSAQAYKEAITSKVNTFIDLSNKADWEHAFDLMYPKLFETVGKAELVGMMDQMAESGVEIKTKKHEIKSFSNLESAGEEDFVLVKYNALQTLKMADELIADETQRGAMIFNLKSMFGSESVHFDETSKAFVIDADKSMYAVSKKGAGEWFLVENNEEQDELLNILIPEEIRAKFKN